MNFYGIDKTDKGKTEILNIISSYVNNTNHLIRNIEKKKNHDKIVLFKISSFFILFTIITILAYYYFYDLISSFNVYFQEYTRLFIVGVYVSISLYLIFSSIYYINIWRKDISSEIKRYKKLKELMKYLKSLNNNLDDLMAEIENKLKDAAPILFSENILQVDKELCELKVNYDHEFTLINMLRKNSYWVSTILVTIFYSFLSKIFLYNIIVSYITTGISENTVLIINISLIIFAYIVLHIVWGRKTGPISERIFLFALIAILSAHILLLVIMLLIISPSYAILLFGILLVIIMIFFFRSTDEVESTIIFKDINQVDIIFSEHEEKDK